MDFIQAIVIGIIQGLTEFIPVSSSAHMRVVPALLGWADPGAPFSAAVQISTTLALLIYFWRDLWKIFIGWTGSFFNAELRGTAESRQGWAIVIGTIPVVVIGLLFKDSIETVFRSLYVIAFSLIGLALLLGVAEFFGSQTKDIDDVDVKSGIWIGFWQALSVIPGMSRSGSTITGGLFAGFDRESAARFSFLLSVPAILGAAIFCLKSHASELLGMQLMPLIVANIAGFISGYFAIAFLMKYLRTHSLMLFIVYRVVLGLLILGLLYTGHLKPF